MQPLFFFIIISPANLQTFLYNTVFYQVFIGNDDVMNLSTFKFQITLRVRPSKAAVSS